MLIEIALSPGPLETQSRKGERYNCKFPQTMWLATWLIFQRLAVIKMTFWTVGQVPQMTWKWFVDASADPKFHAVGLSQTVTQHALFLSIVC